MFLLCLPYFLLSGIIAGILGGLFGIGGGLVFIPVQLAVFQQLNIPLDIQMQVALATSLSCVVINTLSSSYAHHRRGSVHSPIVKKVLIGVVVGSICGGLLAGSVPSKILKLTFGGFQCLFGLYFLTSPSLTEHLTLKDPNKFLLNSTLAITSAISVILGIGGGIFLVPILTYLHLPLRISIGSASLITLFVASIGASTMLLNPSLSESLNYSIGYLFLPAFFPLSIGSLLGAPIGVMLAHKIALKLLKPIFGATIILLGASILFKS
jgi:uncharacterized membrane protein YfcA